MTTSFSCAAVEQIAACVGVESAAGQTRAERVVADYLSLEAPSHFGVSVPFAEEGVFFEVMGNRAVLRLYRYAGLLEVAVTAGYVDLGDLPDRDRLHQALTRFEAIDSQADQRGDLTFVEALRTRLEGNAPPRSATLDAEAFYGYAAYLALAGRVERDEAFKRFLTSSNESWREDEDLPCLVSPRHFAQAVFTGSIGAIDATAVLGGVRAISHVADLVSFEERASGVDGLYTKALRCARWAHEIDFIARRLDLWITRMGEWSTETDSQSWSERFQSAPKVLLRLRSQVRELLPHTARAVDEVKVLPYIEDLIAQGRLGAALWRIRRELEAHWPDGAAKDLAEFLRRCIQLAQIGAPDEAAGWIDRALSHFGDDFDRFNLYPGDKERALKILADSRLGQVAESAQPVASTDLLVSGFDGSVSQPNVDDSRTLQSKSTGA